MKGNPIPTETELQKSNKRLDALEWPIEGANRPSERPPCGYLRFSRLRHSRWFTADSEFDSRK